MSLQTAIEQLVVEGASADKTAARDVFARLRAALSAETRENIVIRRFARFAKCTQADAHVVGD